LCFHSTEQTIGFRWKSSDGGTIGDEITRDGTTTYVAFAGVDFARAWGNDLVIGVSSSATNYFDGLMYQPIVFDRQLNKTEAEELYLYGITGQD
jgi:hypothetical protein